MKVEQKWLEKPSMCDLFQHSSRQAKVLSGERQLLRWRLEQTAGRCPVIEIGALANTVNPASEDPVRCKARCPAPGGGRPAIRQ